MPTYVYEDKEGNRIEKVVPIEDRDNQPGLQRKIAFTGTVYAPTAGGMK